MNLEALHMINYGLYVVSSRQGEKINGQIANTVFQITSQPPTLAVSINQQNLTHEFIQDSGVFTVSILSQDTPLSFIGNFGFNSGREVDKFVGIGYKTGETGAPVVTDNAVAYLEMKVTKEVDVGTHTIFIGELVGAEVLTEDVSMTYAHYHLVKRGTTPKTAPSYVDEKKMATSEAPKYRCNVCGYIYDPEQGDADSGIAPGTPFEELPDDWVCPVCGAAKSEFEKI